MSPGFGAIIPQVPIYPETREGMDGSEGKSFQLTVLPAAGAAWNRASLQ